VPSVTDALIQRLYQEPPDGFVAARTAAINEARQSGDRETAKRLAALKKPTVAAWVVNLLALRRPDLIEQLVDLSTALRDAQRGLDGDQLRELNAQRRQVVSALVGAARKLATEALAAESGGRAEAAKLPLGEVEATLTAALAEPAVAAQVRTGRLIRAATYAGFGEVPRPRLRLVSDNDEVEEDDDSGAEGEVVEFPQQPSRERQAAERRRRRASSRPARPPSRTPARPGTRRPRSGWPRSRSPRWPPGWSTCSRCAARSWSRNWPTWPPRCARPSAAWTATRCAS